MFGARARPYRPFPRVRRFLYYYMGDFKKTFDREPERKQRFFHRGCGKALPEPGDPIHSPLFSKEKAARGPSARAPYFREQAFSPTAVRLGF